MASQTGDDPNDSVGGDEHGVQRRKAGGWVKRVDSGGWDEKGASSVIAPGVRDLHSALDSGD